MEIALMVVLVLVLKKEVIVLYVNKNQLVYMVLLYVVFSYVNQNQLVFLNKKKKEMVVFLYRNQKKN
ncbi:hypothetical protein EB061_10345 [bacterium]|nr:hypothetical protein [bacterium]